MIPLCPLAIEAFTEALALAGNSPYVFPGRDDVTAPIDRMSLTHAMFRLSERLRKKAVIEGGEHAPEFKEKLSAHDLRRSASVFMGRNKVHREDRGKVLAHVDESMTAKNYSPFDDLDAKRAALLALEGHIQKICKFGAPTVPDRTPLTSRLKIRRREFA